MNLPRALILAAAIACSATLVVAQQGKGKKKKEEPFVGGKEITATPAEKLKVKPGFVAELLYSVPKDKQGSWVNLCVDPKGRLIVSDQYGSLYRVTPGKGAADTKVEPIPAEIGEAQGLLWAFDSLYVVVNRGKQFASGLYKVTDSNNDDVLDKVELLKPITGGAGEHGPHAVLLTPDGKSLVVVCGNQTKLMEYDTTKVPPHWGEDHLLPRMPDGRGFMAGVLGPGGTIYKVSPDGKSWEVICTGFRNQFDAAFNKLGDLFTYDADMEWDVNTPWYRPTRVCQVLSGVDFGWRNGAGKWPAHYPDSMGAVVNVGPGSPTGVCFGYGTRFPAKYQDALFICDWSYGKLYATHMKADGASYAGELEEFVSGSPLALTDVIVNPAEGCLYFTVGGRRTQSGLYRVRYIGNEPTGPSPAMASSEPRESRLALEKFHGVKDPAAIDAAWAMLGSADRAIRGAARIALEHQEAASWKDKALAEADADKALGALLALARVSAADPAHRKPGAPEPDGRMKEAVLKALDRLQSRWDTLTERQQADLLRIYAITFVRMGGPDEPGRAALAASFEPRFPSGRKLVDGDLAQLLVFLQAPNAARRIVPLLASAPTQEEQMDLAKSLRMLKTGWTPELRDAQVEWLVKARGYRGGNSFGGFLDNIQRDTVATFTDGEKAKYAAKLEKRDVAAIPAAPPRPLVKKYSMSDLDGKLAQGLAGGRNFERGRLLFGQTTCFSCHRYGNEGGAQGPDLTGVAGRFSPRDLLESILDPSKTVSDQYQAVVIETDDGKLTTGRIVNLNGDNMMVMTNMMEPNSLTPINRRKVESVTPAKNSMMPAGLIDSLKEDEVMDLLAYLLSRGDSKSPMFR